MRSCRRGSANDEVLGTGIAVVTACQDMPAPGGYAKDFRKGWAMNQAATVVSKCLLCLAVLSAIGSARGQDKDIPEALKPWKGWVTWGDNQRNCPTPFNAADKHICFWPSKLSLAVEQGKATWTIAVDTFDETWVPLPG